MNILALDPGTKTGFALAHNGTIHVGTWNFSPRRGDGAGMRFLRLCWQLDEVLQNTQDLRVVYELPAGHYKSGAADDCIKGLVAHIQSWCEQNKIPCEGFAPTEIKKWATGKGNSNKDMMLAEARRRFGHTIADHNQADARLLLEMTLEDQQSNATTRSRGGDV